MQEQGWTVEEFRAVFGKNYLPDGWDVEDAVPYTVERDTVPYMGGGFAQNDMVMPF